MIKKLFTVLIIALIIYAAVVFVPPYYHYYAFRSDLKEFARIGRALPHRELMDNIMGKARGYNIPIDENDIIVTRYESSVHIEASWQERVNFLNIYEKTFNFSIYAGE